MTNLSDCKVSKVSGPSEGLAKASEGVKSLNCMDRRDTGKLYSSISATDPGEEDDDDQPF